MIFDLLAVFVLVFLFFVVATLLAVTLGSRTRDHIEQLYEDVQDEQRSRTERWGH